MVTEDPLPHLPFNRRKELSLGASNGSWYSGRTVLWQHGSLGLGSVAFPTSLLALPVSTVCGSASFQPPCSKCWLYLSGSGYILYEDNAGYIGFETHLWEP